MDEHTRELDLDDATYAENSRGAYPIHAIPNIVENGQSGHAHNIIMLTCDAFGVMPPIAKLSTPQAMYHFLSGYTAKVAGTERGVTEPTATFSTCFGAPFMPRHPSVYGELLRERIDDTGATCWLVNTGWTGGPHGEGHRMPISATRKLLDAALDGSLNDATFREDENFGFLVPVGVAGVDKAILDPRSTWCDADRYDEQARKLAGMFRDNFEKFLDHVAGDVRDAAPGA
jgi:phosphoenolpyruvate carboxykinase (ATP)